MKVEEVKDLNGLEPNRVYMTKDHSILKNTEGNRGQLNSARINKIKKLIKNGEFINEVSFLLVNKRGEIIDGNHRFVAQTDMGLPLFFIITDVAKFNRRDKNEVLDNIARINSGMNPVWSSKDNWKSAIESEVEIAVKLDELKKEIIEKFDLSDSSVSLRDLYGILKQKFGEKVTRHQLVEESDGLVDIMKTERFKKDISFYGLLHEYLKNTPYRTYKIIKEVFNMAWAKGDDFDRNRFYTNMLKGFAVDADRVELYREKIEELESKKTRGKYKEIPTNVHYESIEEQVA